MSDRTIALLDDAADEARVSLSSKGTAVARLQGQLAAAEAEYAEVDVHLRALDQMRALLTGQAADLTADDVQSADDVIGISIGRLVIAPPDDDTDDDLAAYAETMRRLVDHANHQARLVTDVLNERRTRDEGTPVDPSPAQALATIAQAQHPERDRVGVCVNCKLPIADHGGGWQHTGTWSALCHPAAPSSPYAQPVDPFDIGPDPEGREPLLDPDCRDGKCGSCIGGPCECSHHNNDAPAQPHAYRIAFHKLGRKKDLTPLEVQASSIEQLERLIVLDAARQIGADLEEIRIIDDGDTGVGVRGRVLRKDREIGRFTVERIAFDRTDPRPAADLVSAARDEEEVPDQ